MGFRPSITKILQALQPCALTRQTLLFSATMPGDVLQVAQIATRKGAATKLIDTVGEETSTNTQVDQHVTLTTMANQPAELLALVGQLTAERPFKLVVFFVTARLTQLYAEAFNALGVHVLEMHSRKSQPQRTKCAEQFREGDNLILFTSDVSARGMDYPDVTAVVQVGMPSDKAQYIHRLGRTARAGKAGGGFLLLNDFESFFLSQLSDLPVKQRPPLAPAAAAPLAQRLTGAFGRLSDVTLGCGYQAWLGFYNSHLRKLRWSQESRCAR